MNDSKPMITKTDAAELAQFNRRDFLKVASGSGIGMMAAGAVSVWPVEASGRGEKRVTKRNRRNLIIFLTDQERPTMWFPEGWEAENRPALTELKQTGVSFQNAFSNTSMCTPARNTLFTGLYPAQHRCADTVQQVNIGTVADNQLDPTVPNLGTVLQAEGYEVVYKGKWHLTEGIVRPDGVKVDDDPSRNGFDGWNGPDIGSDADPARLYGGGKYNQDGRVIEGYDWSANGGAGGINPELQELSALAYLQHKLDHPGDKPFCLVISLVNPHDLIGYPTYSGDFPTVSVEPSWGYDRSILSGSLTKDAPTFSEVLLTNLKPSTQVKYNVISNLVLGALPEVTDQSGTGSLNYMNFYANALKLVDAEFKKVLDLIRGTALRSNSWIVHTSDHGELGLCHGGLRQKGFCAYEETIKVPMVWSNPVDFAKGGKLCSELVSHVDFLPTVCSMLGINSRRYRFSGVDYSSLIKKPGGRAVQDSILITYDDIYAGQSVESFPGGIVPPPNRLRALRDKESKYVYYFDADGVELPEGEFYDVRPKCMGGTDTDRDNGLGGTTGDPVEYVNLSIGAENKRKLLGRPTRATPDLVAKRRRMQAQLQQAVRTKLQPFPTKKPQPPQDVKLEVLSWIDDQGGAQEDILITWISRNTTQYQLQSSIDQITWTDVGETIEGNNGPLLITVASAGTTHGYYRLNWSANELSTKIPQPQLQSAV
ncbi:MAG: sulfatase-like hydrolase/transferase [Akkermansiaceae bacterium]